MIWHLSGFAKATSRRDGGATRETLTSDGRRVARDELAVGTHPTTKLPNHPTNLPNHPTTKLPNHQTILAHAEARRRGGAEDFGIKERKVEGAMSNHQTTKLPNHPTTKPVFPTTKLPNHQTTKLPNHPTTKLPTTTAMTEETNMKAQSTSIHAPCSMLNAQSRKVRSGRRWTAAAAAWILAAGTLLGGAGEAHAYYLQGTFVFNASGWGTLAAVKMMYGHGGYSECLNLTNISNTQIYYGQKNITDWGDEIKQIVFIGGDVSGWGGENNSPNNRRTYASHYTATYYFDTGSYAFNNKDSHYFFSKESADNDASTVGPTYYESYSSLNLSGTLGVKVKNYGAADSTYAAPSTSPAKVTMSGYKLTSWTAAGASSATISAGGSTVSTTYSTVLGNTVTYAVSSVASGYAFVGWYNASGTQLSTSTSYTSDFYTSTPPAVYAHFTKAVAPTIGTPTSANVETTTAKLGAKVTSNGGSAITEYGIVWGTSANPTTGDHKVIKASAAPTLNSAWTVDVSSLPPGTTIHYRGYAINGVDTGYTSDASFTTKPAAPTITLDSNGRTVSSLKFKVGANGNGTATTYKYSVVESDSGTPATDCTDNVTGATTITKSSLSKGKQYYIRAMATANSVNSSVTSLAAATRPGAVAISDDITTTSSSVTFTIEANGNGNATIYYYYIDKSSSTAAATVTNSGTTCTAGTPVTATTMGNGTALTSGTDYYLHAVGYTAGTVGYWVNTVQHKAFTTASGVVAPTVGAASASGVTTNAATVSLANISAGGAAATVTFQYKLTSASTWTTYTPAPADLAADDTGKSRSVDLTGLTAGQSYDYKWTVANSAGSTPATGSFTTASEIALSANSWTYNGSNPTATVSGGGGTGAYSVTLDSTDPASAGTVSLGGTGNKTLTLTPSKAGTFNITVTKEAQGEYAAQSKAFALSLAKGDQTISGLSDITKTYGNAAFNLGATSSAGLTVSYTSSATGVATISGKQVTIVGAGTSTITAKQAGNDLWNAAPNVTATLTVNKAAQTLTFSPASPVFGADVTSYTVTASGNGSPTITYSSGSTAVASINSSSGVMTRGSTGYGTVTITAIAAETANYLGKTGTVSVTVMGKRPTSNPTKLTFTATGTTTANIVVRRASDSSGIVLVMKAGAAPGSTAKPTDGSRPTANPAYGTAGAALGDSYVVYANTGGGSSDYTVQVTGLTAGTTYYVVAYPYMGGSSTYSYKSTGYQVIGTTPPNTPTLAAAADGKTMVRLNMTKPSGTSSGMVLVYGGNDAPSGAPGNAGTALGGGTIVWKGTATTTGFEHVVPAGATHGYRLFAYAGTGAGTAYSAAAEQSLSTAAISGGQVETFSYTNGTGISSTYWNQPDNGWSSTGWAAWDSSSSYIKIAQPSINGKGLLNSNRLNQAGGNAMDFNASNATRVVRAYRAFDSAYTSGKVWFMFSVRTEFGGDEDGKTFGAQFMSTAGDSSTIFASVGKPPDRYTSYPGLAVDTSKNGSGLPAGSSITWGGHNESYVPNYSLADYGHGSPAGNNEATNFHTIYGYIDLSASNNKMYVNAAYSGTVFTNSSWEREPTSWDVNGASISASSVAGMTLYSVGYCGRVQFDEVRVASTWAELLGGSEPVPGDLAAWTAQADGNEMVRLSFTAPANAQQVIILDKSTSANLTSAEKALRSGAVGDTAGAAKVIWKGSVTAGSSYNVEFVVPAGSTHYFHACAQNVTQYSANWTRATATPNPLTTGTYPASCAVAEAFAYTNGTFLTTSAGSQAWMNGGKGWAGAWNLTSVPGSWSPGEATKNASGVEGLLETTQLSGAGGNMFALYPGTEVKSENKKAVLKRELTTALSSGGTWWGMFTMKISTSAANSWAGIQLLDASGASKASIGKLWGGTKAGIEGSATGSSTYGVTADHAYVYIFKWDGSKMWLHVQHVESTSNPDFSSYSTPNFTDTDDTSVSLSMADIKYVQLVAENGNSGESGTCVGDTWFDEIRFGPSFAAMVGGSSTRPAAPGTLTATRDGNEMYRLSWKKNGTGSDVILVGTTDGSAPPTALEDNTSYAVGATVAGTTAKVLYKGGATALDHVVAPGTTCKYRLFSDNGDGLYSSTGSYAAPEATPTYESWECLDTFSYTNGVQVSASGNGWIGGQGWGTTGDHVNYWGNSGSGNWYALKPEQGPATLCNHVVNYPDSAGNILCVTNVSDGQSATNNRSVTPFGGSRGNTVYFAYRMAYAYKKAGHNRWAGLQFLSGERSIFVGKAGSEESDRAGHLGITATGGSSPCWPNVGDGGSAFGLGSLEDNVNNTYIIVGKIDWTADNTATIYANAFYTGGGSGELPENEPSWGSYGYSGATMGAIDNIQFIAGAKAGQETIGYAYFDELRWGTSWEQLLAGKAPTDVWMDGQTTHVYTGDIVTNAITSTPKGAKQSAQSLIWTAANPNDTTWETYGIAAGFYTNKESETQTEWHGVHQITQTAATTLYGLGAVTGNGTTVKSQNHGEAAYKTHTYTVRALTAPSLSVTPGDFKENLSWTRATGYNEAGTSSTGRTFQEVMVVRYSSSAASGLEGLKPVDGTAYYPGDVIYYNNDPAETRYMTVVYRGSDATSHVDAGLAKNTTYYYAAFTVNNTYYSPKSDVQHGQTTGSSTTPTVDGSTTDWVGGASPTKNSAAYSEEEFIWTDKALEGRKDTDACLSADIGEFRVKATASTVYFLLRLTNAPATGVKPTNTYVVVGVDTRTNSASTAMNWLGDESATFVGGGYYQTNAAIHYPERQMAVHYVGGSENTWQVEMYAENGAEWYAPQSGDWAAACSADNSSDPCIEWSVPREDLGLAGICTGRFTVATFVNSGNWNNQGVGTVRIGDDSCAAVDAMETVPYGVNDQDGKLGSWDEGLKNGNVNFWADVRFAAAGLDTHSAPTVPSPGTGATGPGSPLLRWSASSDTDGFVTGYLLEVATNAAFGAAGDLLLYRVNVEGAATTSFQTRTSVSNFYWRVRARDSAGILSAGTAQAYEVTGKTDRDGPLAKLLYVGTNVMAFINNTDGYRDDQEKSGDATSVEDSDLQDGGHTFGFVIEWYDVNGVYAMNKNRNTGEFAWNILAEHEDGVTPYGRVSPNWDLLIIDRKTPAGTPPAAETVDGKPLTYTWKTGLELPTENGGTETVDCWYIDCGKDAVFQPAEIINDGNFGQCMTNYVTGAFQFGGYRDGVELYLTVSAEDGCMDTGNASTSGDAGWYPWPSWYNGSSGSYGDGPQTDVNCSGYCADGPHLARNVTTNQLLKFYVRDNDVQPPVASTNLWGADATDASGAKFTPSLVVATSAVTQAQASGAWGSIPGKLAPVSGAGRDTVYQLTDQAIGRNLTFLFNVYDEYLHSGLQLGAAKTATVSGRTLTNTTAMVRTWDAESGEWVASDENWKDYKSGLSTIWDINPTTGAEAVGTSGTGPKTVLAWDFGTITEDNIDSLFGVDNILSYIGTNSAGATNLVQLHLRDRDNNREGDQADAELTFGRLMLTDDDATEPVSPGYALLGSGTNYVEFGALASWEWTAVAKPASWSTNTGLKGIDATEMSAWSVGSSSDTAITGDSVKWTERSSSVPAGQDWSAMSRRYMSLDGGMQGATYQSAGGAKYFQFDVCGENGARWTADTLQFDNRVTAKGPTLYTLTVQEAANVTTLAATTADGQKDPDWNVTGGVFEKANGILRFTLENAGGTASLASPSFQPNSNGRAMTRVQYRVGRIGAVKEGATLTVGYRIGSGARTVVKTHASSDFTDSAANKFANYEVVSFDLPTDQAGNFTVTWEASGINGSQGFLLTDVSVVMQNSFNTEHPLVENVLVEKAVDSSTDGSQETIKNVVMSWAGTENAEGTTWRYRLYAFGADGTGNWGINKIKLLGITMSPRGMDVTDGDLRHATWVNSLEVVDGEKAGWDTEKSGLWLTGDKAPSYVISYPEADAAGRAGTAVASGPFAYKDGKIRKAAYSVLPDGTFEAEPTAWTLSGATIGAGSGTRERVLKLAGEDSAVSSATRGFDVSLGSIAAADVSGVTVSGGFEAKASVAEGSGGVNGLTVTVRLKDAGGNVLLAKTFEYAPVAAWRQLDIGPWTADNALVRKAEVEIAQTTAEGTELLVANVALQLATWGAPTGDFANGEPGAKLELQTQEVAAGKTLKLSDELTGEGSKEYVLASTVHDYDRDRTDDALAVTITTGFELHDDDTQAPSLGAKFGGPVGMRLGNRSGQAYNGSGTDVQVVVTDQQMDAAKRDGQSLAYLDIDGYDQSGWTTTALALNYTEGGSAKSLAYAGTDVTEGAAGLPSATNTFHYDLSTLWANTFVKSQFASHTANMTVNATLTDQDDDRADDSLATTSQLGYLKFMDNDTTAPAMRSSGSLKGMFIATNPPGGSITTALTGVSNATWAAKSQYEVRVLNSSDTASDRVQLIYDGELARAAPFYLMANVGDALQSGTGVSIAGLQRGDAVSRSIKNGFNDTIAVSNTTMVLSNSATIVTNLATHFNEGYSSAFKTTRGGTAAAPQTWYWPTGMTTNEVGFLLPPESASLDFRVLVEAFDSDTNRPSDQAHARLEGPTLRVRDDDTLGPNAPGSPVLWANGAPFVGDPEGASIRYQVPWTNSTSGLSVHFVAATDKDGTPTGADKESARDANGLYDLATSGIGGYWWAAPDADISTTDAATALKLGSDSTDGGVTKKTAPLSVTMEQGYGRYKLFAVDDDADRGGDSAIGADAGVLLGYDCTKPTKVAVAGADTQDVGDPTTQMDLSWSSTGVGPDDPTQTVHPQHGGENPSRDLLSPWETYKVYYRSLNDDATLAEITSEAERKSHIYDNYVAGEAYKVAGWTTVTKDSPIADTSHGEDDYLGLGAADTASVRVFDLDFDQEYVFVIVGVDRAGNEGPADENSWATNNTIKFAVTQGVVKATAAIDAMVTSAVGSGIQRPDLETAPKRGAVLYWKAAENKTTGVVNKEYDLIYRDASSFTETNTGWRMATSGSGDAANSGTSKANWNYQTRGLGRYDLDGKLRFFRASYHNRWQDTKPGTGEKQTPLASEEVYSMNNVVLSEGFNYVSLQGVPWTNTFRGVFGADTDMWPGGSDSADTNGAAVIEFYTPGTAGNVGVEWYFFGKDGKWYKPGTGTEMVDYTDKTDLDADFFARPFSINMPAYDEEDADNWWKSHSEFTVTNGVKVRQAMLWHPIMQVPTNGVVADASASTSSVKPGARDGAASGALVFRQSVTAAKGVYNTLSLNLPVSVHPSELRLVATNAAGVPQPGKMKAGNWVDADKLYVIDSATKEIRGNSTMYCDAEGIWRYNKNRLEVTGTPILPNDMLILISAGGNGENGATVDWVWTYSPSDFYKNPTRHMGR